MGGETAGSLLLVWVAAAAADAVAAALVRDGGEVEALVPAADDDDTGRLRRLGGCVDCPLFVRGGADVTPVGGGGGRARQHPTEDAATRSARAWRHLILMVACLCSFCFASCGMPAGPEWSN